MKDAFDQIVADMAAQEPAIVAGNLFGKPCAKSDGKAFVAFFQDCMVFKLGEARCQDVMRVAQGSQLFDPSGKGRSMKAWVQVPMDAADWRELAAEAFAALS